MGTRLMPLTKEIPKPLLEVNGMTLLERMMKNLMNEDIKVGTSLLYIHFLVKVSNFDLKTLKKALF